MKLSALAVALTASAALVAGGALAQATMAPIPNPPGPTKSEPMSHHRHHHHHGHHHHHHHGMHHHWRHRHHMKGAMKDDKAAAPAPAAPPAQ